MYIPIICECFDNVKDVYEALWSITFSHGGGAKRSNVYSIRNIDNFIFSTDRKLCLHNKNGKGLGEKLFVENPGNP